jgi:hypothetical protein
MKRKVLITQQELANFGGSEVVTLEITKYALSLGFQVTILTNYFGPPVSDNPLPGVKIVGPDQPLELEEFSHIWIHHNFIPKSLLDYLGKGTSVLLSAKIAFHHMSPYVPIESPLIPTLETAIADSVYFNSPETEAAYQDLFANKKKLKVLGNPAPDEFSLNTRGLSDKKTPESVLVVSNHPPQEMLDALAELKSEGLLKKYDLFGVHGSAKLITPQELTKYDAIISIGKTVQYGILAGLPVYCYDHFGGSGYLNEKTFDLNRFYNFSGRGFKKKSIQVIKTELINKYSKAVIDAQFIKDTYSDDFSLSKKLHEFFQPGEPKHVKVDPTDVHRAHIQVSLNSNSIESIVYLRNRVKELSVKNDELIIVSSSLRKENIELTRKFNRTIYGFSRRLFRKLLKLMKIVRT